MISASNRTFYKAFGLTLSSEMSLPELPQIFEGVDQVDVEISKDDLSAVWQQIVHPRKSLIRENLVMFKNSDTAIFCIQEGKRIIFSPMKDSDEDEIRLFILGTCMGALLMQKKILTLHGSAVAIDGKAYGFIGDSGAGKSTLASAFLKKGYQLLTDDLIAVNLFDGTPFVMPAYPQQKLWEASLQQFGMETGCYKPIYQRETKYAIPVSSRFSYQPMPLAGLFELVKTENEAVELQRISPLEQLQILFQHTYRNFLVPYSGVTQWHFNISVNIASQIDIVKLGRPALGFTANDMATLILNSLRKEAS